MITDTFDQWWRDYFGKRLSLNGPAALPATKTGWPEAPESGWEAAWEAATRELVAAASPAFEQTSSARLNALGRAFDTQSARIELSTVKSVVNRTLRVAPQDDFDCNPHKDFWYFKINHGYWEQLFRILGTYDAVKMRVRPYEDFKRAYADSAFSIVLESLLLDFARVEDSRVSFPGMHFGVSLNNGNLAHEPWLEGIHSDAPQNQQVLLGTSIGLLGWFESLFGVRELCLADGSFPKRAAVAGTLRETLHKFARHSNRILFVVPPHLDGIALNGVDMPQETLLVPGARVHECWAAALWATTRHVLARLETDTRVLVITQSAVFSAMLATFLRAAKEALAPVAHHIFFFDLGQVIDSAAPASGGRWISLNEVADQTLFGITGPKRLS